jgi:cell division protein FtsI/penicillin-binding protein 2
VLGFVNDADQGNYGVEQALNDQLKGKPGMLKAITDSHGVPLAASKNNIDIAPTRGSDVTLTINLGMQQQLETILKKNIEAAQAERGSALIIEPQTGAVKAMANFPTYDPNKFADVDDSRVFNNASVSRPIEIGSIMKPMTTAAAINEGVVRADTTYYDPMSWTIDKHTITNVERAGGPGPRSIAEVLNLSLNTGATWELMQMSGGGNKITTKGRELWYGYMTERYRFGQKTGIEQGYEASGYVPKPADNGAGINLTYANTAFGQAMTATPIQVAGAISSVLNGGTYYQPRLIDKIDAPDGKTVKYEPKVLKTNVVSSKVSRDMIGLMQYVVQNHRFGQSFDHDKYLVGGKTGTAQVAKPGGGYYDDQFNGTYEGFVGGDEPQYVIVVFTEHPKVPGYAGSVAAQPIFADLAHMLIDNSFVTPKRGS